MIIRIETDSLGPIQITDNKLWGAQTQRALKYFKVSDEKIPWAVIKALAQIKRIAAQVNYDLELLDLNQSQAIVQSADEILSGMHMSEFPLSVWQTGSGTQTNMNMNEVLSHRANLLLRQDKKDIQEYIHPNDHVNKNQSSNDVFPSAMHIAAVVNLNEKLIPIIKILQKTLLRKSIKFRNIIKIGRTHLQDAIPLTVGQEISGWEFMLRNNLNHIKSTIPYLRELALGGTAVGTGFGAHPEFPERVVSKLSHLIGHDFCSAPNKFESLSSCDALVHSHAALKGLSVSMMKIANDIRLLTSGPRCGFNEFSIPGNEPGSSIMPGKINPTQCESMAMICCQVMGNDVSIGIGGASGNLELNVYRPLIIYNFLQSICLLTDGIRNFHDYCILGLQPNLNQIQNLLNKSIMLVTALSKYIGYDKAAQIAKKAYLDGVTLKIAAIELGYVTSEQFDKWVYPKHMIGFYQ